MKKITVIILCYNSAPYLERCMRSVMRQTVGIDRMELICVYDESEDDTLRILMDYERRYPETVTVVVNESRSSIGHARNVGLGYASGEYVGFVDSDDEAAPGMFEKLCGRADEYDCDVAECSYVFVDDKGEGMERSAETGEGLITVDSAGERKAFILNRLGSVTCWERIYRRAFLDAHQIRFPEEGAPEDEYFTAILLFYVRRCYTVPEPLYLYHTENTRSASRRSDYRQAADKLDMEFRILGEAERRGLAGGYRDVVEYRFIQKYYVEGLMTLVRTYLAGQKEKTELVKVMRSMLGRAFPGWRDNPYLNLPQNSGVREIMKTAETELGDQEMLRLKEMLYPERSGV